MFIYMYADDGGVIFKISYETDDMSVTESG